MYIGGYAIADMSEVRITIATDTGSQTVTNLDPELVGKFLQTKKPLDLKFLTITANGVAKEFNGYMDSFTLGGITTFTLDNVSIFAPTETSLTVTLGV